MPRDVTALKEVAPGASTGPLSPEPPRLSRPMEDEVYSSLGALLGMLEVLAIDVGAPLSARQQALVADALQFGDVLRARVEALVTLLTDERDPRFRPGECTVRRLVDHAVRAAAWGAVERQVTLTLPESGAWDDEILWIDVPRTDRTLRAITDALVSAVGEQGVVALHIDLSPRSVRLVLTAARAETAAIPLALPNVVCAAWRRVLELQRGTLSIEPDALRVCVELPKAGAGELP